MNDQIKQDLFRYVGNDCHRLLMQLRYIIFTPGFRYIYYLRKVQQGGNFKFLAGDATFVYGENINSDSLSNADR